MVGHLRAERETAIALRRATLQSLPALVRPLANAAESVNGWWLRRNATPYRDEILEMARLLGEPGVISLNTSYEWGCTTLGLPSSEGARLFRTLDWPFPGPGRSVQVVRMRGAAGEYWNVTWPGAAGVLTAMAPGRFAAALNQAPLRRRTRGELPRVADFALNGVNTLLRVRDMPGMHLLRLVFEEAATVEEALDRLMRTPIARPCIFTLVGCEPDEIFVVEKTEHDARVLLQPGATANAFRPGHHYGAWEARPCGCAFAEAPANNAARGDALDCSASMTANAFDWLEPPILNGFTRLAVEADPRVGSLRVRGYEPNAASDVIAVTELDLMSQLTAAASQANGS